MDQTKEFYDTIVIGAGQAGLAAGYFLSRRGRDFIILEAEGRAGASWRKRWDSLRLFTPARFSSLPGMPFPTQPDYFPTKDETAQYMEDYAVKFNLPIRYHSPVDCLAREGNTYRLTSGRQQFAAKHVIVATGTFQKPNIPAFADKLPQNILQLHSSAYRSPAQLLDGDVLVAGAGNSGAEIAIELAGGTRQVWLSGRDPGRIPIPRKIPGGDRAYWWFISKKLTADSRIGRKARAKILNGGGDPLIGVSMQQVDQSGTRRVGRTVGVKDGKPELADGQVLNVNNVIWATGYVPDYHWIELPIFDGNGLPEHTRGIVDQEPGLYFLGLRFMYSLSSPLIGGVGADAGYIASVIDRKSGP